jgi:hypothetical protein
VSVFDRFRRDRDVPEGMVPAERLARAPRPGPAPAGDPGLLAERDRLVERFALMQSELGGLYYEMAVRDHVRDDVLARKAAELQRVDAELAAVERLLRTGDVPAGTACGSCGAPAGATDVFCAQCGSSLAPRTNGAVV